MTSCQVSTSLVELLRVYAAQCADKFPAAEIESAALGPRGRVRFLKRSALRGGYVSGIAWLAAKSVYL